MYCPHLAGTPEGAGPTQTAGRKSRSLGRHGLEKSDRPCSSLLEAANIHLTLVLWPETAKPAHPSGEMTQTQRIYFFLKMETGDYK